MAENERKVRVVLLDGEEKIYTNAFADTVREGWLDIYRPPQIKGGRAGVIAGHLMSNIKMWEYIE